MKKSKNMLGMGKFFFQPFIGRFAKLMEWIGDTTGVGARILIGCKMLTKRH